MIRSLEIHGLVVIEQAELEFGDGLTVLTGETGAGKTVLTNALGLLAGAPADAGVVRPGHRQALVQATFRVPAQFWSQLDDDDPAAALRELVDDTGAVHDHPAHPRRRSGALAGRRHRRPARRGLGTGRASGAVIRTGRPAQP